MNDKAEIFDIRRNSFVDGPGIRTTVFFKGCNLHCRWCHNPESQSPKRQLLFYEGRCTACGVCSAVCPRGEGECTLCGRCASVCPNHAKELCGGTYTPEQLLKIIAKDKRFYQASGGGVTFSGGECMLQIDFLEHILKLCRQNGIHTAVDTAGNVSWDRFARILPYTDLFLYDVKSMDPVRHKEYTGADNTRILRNLAELLRIGANVIVRFPVIPGVNDAPWEMERLGAFYETWGHPVKTELLPYHAMGEHKCYAVGRMPEHFSVPSEQTLTGLKGILDRTVQA